MSKIQDYSTNSSKSVLQSNSTVTFTVPILPKNHAHKVEPPLKKKKIHLVTVEKLTNANNNNSPNLESACSVSGRIKPNIVITKGESATRKMKTVSSISCQTRNHQLLSILDLSNNARAIKFYTGFNDREQFMRVFETLGPDKYDLKYFYSDQPVNLSLVDQFLIVLIVLKQHKSHYEISIMFNITLKDIKNIFITWIRFMRLEWNNIKIKKVKKLAKKISVLKSDRTLDAEKLQCSNQSCMEIIGVDQHNPNDCLKKMYKILSDGPANYIESHLVNDIQFVCQRLHYLTARNYSEVPTMTFKPLIKLTKLIKNDINKTEDK